jgi:hypothetical protein
MHYIIAREILKEKSFDKNLFILGNLSPDSHKGTLQGNSCAHFRRIVGDDYDIYPNIDLKRFKEKYLSKEADEFIAGYYCHLVSDYTWVELIYPNYLQFTTDAEKSKKQREALFNDLTVLNTILSKHYKLDCIEKLTIPEYLSISEFSQEGLTQLLEALIQDFSNKHYEVPLRIFNEDFILEYLNLAVERCIKELDSLKL